MRRGSSSAGAASTEEQVAVDGVEVADEIALAGVSLGNKRGVEVGALARRTSVAASARALTWFRCLRPHGGILFVALKRVPDEPDRRWPETDEEGAPLGIASLVLVHRFRADPQANAQSDRRQRSYLHVRRS